VNQYYSFNGEAKQRLRRLYSDLLLQVKNAAATSGEELPCFMVEHFSRLQAWIKETNPFAVVLYGIDQEYADTVPCSEYSASLQITLFDILLQDMTQPVLDIGCGLEGNLVGFLRRCGIEAYGIDRFHSSVPFLSNEDWHEFDYGVDRWGTIISHLGFSNHFAHHHQRSGGDFTTYARSYMTILNSLKHGASFYYTPGLPFIEQYLDSEKFTIRTMPVDDNGHVMTQITRLR
jgi:hypothetical protein